MTFVAGATTALSSFAITTSAAPTPNPPVAPFFANGVYYIQNTERTSCANYLAAATCAAGNGVSMATSGESDHSIPFPHMFYDYPQSMTLKWPNCVLSCLAWRIIFEVCTHCCLYSLRVLFDWNVSVTACLTVELFLDGILAHPVSDCRILDAYPSSRCAQSQHLPSHFICADDLQQLPIIYRLPPEFCRHVLPGTRMPCTGDTF